MGYIYFLLNLIYIITGDVDSIIGVDPITFANVKNGLREDALEDAITRSFVPYNSRRILGI